MLSKSVVLTSPLMRGPLILGSFLCLTILTMSGCGYRFGVEGPGPVLGGGEALLSEGQRVKLAIDRLENRTFEPNLELKYSNYLRQEFRTSSGAEVTQKTKDADFLLRGAIESVTLPSLTFTQFDTQESRVVVQVKVEVQNRRTGKTLWVQSATGTAEFFVSGTPASGGGQSGLQFNRILQNRALEQAGQLIAEDLSDRFLLAQEQGVFKESSSDGKTNVPQPVEQTTQPEFPYTPSP